MLLSVSKAFNRKKVELFHISEQDNALTSEATIHHSQQLDHFITLYQNQNQSEITITDKIEGSFATIILKGQLDIVTSESLTSYIESIKQRQDCSNLQHVLIDLSKLKFFDTTGIHPLLLLINQLTENTNIQSIKLSVSETIYHIFNIMEISDYLKTRDCDIVRDATE